LFLTGIVPDEIPAFTHWLGRGYELLSEDEWRACRRWLKGQEATPTPPELRRMGLADIADRIWQTLWDLKEPTTMLGLSLLEYGVIEWVSASQDASVVPFKGMGHPRASFFSTLKRVDKPVVPIDLSRRMRHFGFRLKRR
jgi:hypothetical protein